MEMLGTVSIKMLSWFSKFIMLDFWFERKGNPFNQIPVQPLNRMAAVVSPFFSIWVDVLFNFL